MIEYQIGLFGVNLRLEGVLFRHKWPKYFCFLNIVTGIPLKSKNTGTMIQNLSLGL